MAGRFWKFSDSWFVAYSDDGSNDIFYAYDAVTRRAVPSRNITVVGPLSNTNLEGGAVVGNAVWFVDSEAEDAIRLDFTTGNITNRINLGSGNWQGVVTDQSTLWFIDSGADRARAYNATTRRPDSSKDINLGSGTWLGGTSDGTTLWFVNSGSRDATNMAVAYKASDQTRDSSKNINLGSGTWYGGLTDGTSLYFVSRNDIQAWTIPEPITIGIGTLSDTDVGNNISLAGLWTTGTDSSETTGDLYMLFSRGSEQFCYTAGFRHGLSGTFGRLGL